MIAWFFLLSITGRHGQDPMFQPHASSTGFGIVHRLSAPGPVTKDKICCIEGCSKPLKSNGMCSMHAQRVRRHGDPNHVTSTEDWKKRCREGALRRCNDEAKPTTYRKLHNRHAHRVIAEQMLGRPLERGEIVHHIDGNKHNNDPSNLRVMTQAEHLRLHREEMEQAKRAKRRRADG